MTSLRIYKTIGPYTPGKKIMFNGGQLAFSSGHIGINPQTNELAEDIESQAKEALKNLKYLAEDNGFDLG